MAAPTSKPYNLGDPMPPEATVAKKPKPQMTPSVPGVSGTTVQPTIPTSTPTMPTGVTAGPGTTTVMAGQIQPTLPTANGAGNPTNPGTTTWTTMPAPTQTSAPNMGAKTGPGTTPINQTMNPGGPPPGVAWGPGATPIPQGSWPTGGATPGPGTSPIGPGMNPTTPSNPFMTGFGPGNDLRFQQINPAANDRLQGTQGAVDSAVAALQGGPNRQQLAQNLFADYIAQSQPDFEASLRSITQRNAAGGRLGSGMYGTNLTDAATQRSKDIGSYATRLASETAGGDIQDRLNNVGALAGLEGQQFGQGLTQRNELRGERGYQQGVAGQAQQDAINQRLLEDQLLNSQFGRDYQRYGLLGQLGYGSNPAGTLGGLAGDTQGAANQAGAGVNDLFTQWLLSQGG